MKLQRVYCTDWEAWYLDGKKIAEGHSVPAFLLVAALRNRLGLEVGEPSELTDQEVEALGWSFPDQFEELFRARENTTSKTSP